ncbi:MAG: 2'-5' RNA ligase family protein, partial [Planctomycetota bacterium]
MIKTAIELLFDAQTDATLRGLLDEIDAAGLPSPLIGWGTRPHLSLLLGGAARDGLEEAVAAFGAEPLSVTLDGVGTFPGDKGIVYLAPVVTRALLDIHDAAHAAFGA